MAEKRQARRKYKPRNPLNKKGSAPVRLPPGVAHPIDIYVGDRLRQRRTILGLTQEKLAESVGLTFQQIQKYERGANRIGASRLFQFSQLLGTSINFFFDGLDQKMGDPAEGYRLGIDYRDNAPPERDEMNRRETLELVRAYYRIVDPEKRQVLMSMFHVLASAAKDK